jgi:hypothetical protein
MKPVIPLLLSLALLLPAFHSACGADDSLDPNLEPLRPLFNKTWRGEFKKSTPENPVVDVLTYERALNGKAVRSLHSINDGAYGGETMFIWDAQKQSIVYYYFTTAGFMTTGILKVDGGKFVTVEKVSGRAEGVTEVKAVAELNPDGTFHVKTEHVKDGKSSPGHEVTYKQAQDAKVRFK